MRVVVVHPGCLIAAGCALARILGWFTYMCLTDERGA